MPRIVAAELFELDLPFRGAFRHAAAERKHSGSLFARLVTDTGDTGYGETLPRVYVTGEDRGGTFDLLAEQILPRILEREFASFGELHAFLVACDGKAPPEWVDPKVPQSAAWCLVDLALLDSIARATQTGLKEALSGASTGFDMWPEHLRYSVVLSAGSRPTMLKTLLKARLYGLRDVKVKVGGDSVAGVRLTRRIMGRGARMRVDSNMAWSYSQASAAIEALARYGVESFEQPLAADDLDGLARLVALTGAAVMADESLHDAASLERLIAARACTAANVRIAKCGGLVASLARCKRAIEAGLTLQIGCQVGETSHLSAAQMLLVGLVGRDVQYLEGAFGERLLHVDPVRPVLQFRRGGRPPELPRASGMGTEVDMRVVHRYAGRRAAFGAPEHHFRQIAQ